MTRLTSRSIALIGSCFVLGALVLSGFAAAPAPQDTSANLTHVVKLASVTPQSGDKIAIDEVRGTSDTFSPGNTYEVRGTYKLVSHDKAMLMINVTTDASQPGSSHPYLPDQKMTVEKGEGRFTLRFRMWNDGNPHVSFYPDHGGQSFASAYF